MVYRVLYFIIVLKYSTDTFISRVNLHSHKGHGIVLTLREHVSIIFFLLPWILTVPCSDCFQYPLVDLVRKTGFST